MTRAERHVCPEGSHEIALPEDNILLWCKDDLEAFICDGSIGIHPINKIEPIEISDELAGKIRAFRQLTVELANSSELRQLMNITPDMNNF